jgi:hypothetical protein
MHRQAARLQVWIGLGCATFGVADPDEHNGLSIALDMGVNHFDALTLRNQSRFDRLRNAACRPASLPRKSWKRHQPGNATRSS